MIARSDRFAVHFRDVDIPAECTGCRRRVSSRVHEGHRDTRWKDISLPRQSGLSTPRFPVTERTAKPVTNVQSFREALTKADPRRGVLLYLDRKGSKTFAVLKAGQQ